MSDTIDRLYRSLILLIFAILIFIGIYSSIARSVVNYFSILYMNDEAFVHPAVYDGTCSKQ